MARIHTAHDLALFNEAFPCNPRPFLTALAEHLANGGTTTDARFRRILWTLIGIVRGQLARIRNNPEADRTRAA